jgi:hypothetical protein
MKVLGIEVEKKTDILAFTAFLLSIGSLLSQGFLLFRGSHVVLDGPKQITLFFSDVGAKDDQRNVLNVISNQVYVNNGANGYNDILRSEELRISLQGLSLHLKAQHYVDSFRSKTDATKLQIDKIEAWKPVVIKSGYFEDTETWFVPYPSYEDPASRPDYAAKAVSGQSNGHVRDTTSSSEDYRKNVVLYSDFLTYLMKSRNIDIELASTTYAGQPIVSRCRITLAPRVVAEQLMQKRWTSLECVPINPNIKIADWLFLRLPRHS